MHDKETVMTWLEICGINQDCSETCPYGKGTAKVSVSAICQENLMADAFNLLKEQEAVIEQYRKADTFLEAHGWKWQ